jgi:uncharacterized membrane protein YfcA
VSGLLGAGGAWLLLPLLVRVLQVPTRMAVGSSLGVTLLGVAAAAIGKLATGQVPLALVPAGLLGVVPGSVLGAFLSQKIPASNLRYALAALVGLIALQTWADVLLS